MAVPVAVPAAVGPLRLHERLRERVQPLIAAEADVETRLQRPTVLRRAPSHTPVDATLVDLGEPVRARDPLERLLGCGNGSRVARLDAQVHERKEPPERPSPLRVRVYAVAPGEAGDELVTHGR